MKRKIALLFALLLTASAALVACGDKCDHVDEDRDEACDNCGETVTYDRTYLSFEGLYNSSYEPEIEEKIEFGKAKNNSSLANMTILYRSEGGGLVSFVNAEAKADEIKYAVLNVETAEVVLTLKKEAEDSVVTSSAEFLRVGNEDFVLVTETNTTHAEQGVMKYSTELYTADGKKITTKSTSYIGVEYVYGDLYDIDGKIYEIVDGTANYVNDKGFTDFPRVDLSTETHHYNFSSDGVAVYDLEYKLVACYVAPAETEMKAHILADGNVFIQLFKALPEDADTYDVLLDDVKTDVRSLIFNVTENKASTIAFDYLVDEIFNVNTPSPFDSDDKFEDVASVGAVTNVALFYDVVSKTPNTNDPLVADFDNAMKLNGYLGGEIDHQMGVSKPIGGNRYIATNKAGERFLLNEKGEVIGALGDAYYDEELMLFFVGGKYYDLDLKQVYDANEIDYQYLFVGGYGDIRIYAKEKGTDLIYFVRNGNEMIELEMPKNVSGIEIYDGYFTYTYFTETQVSGGKDGEDENGSPESNVEYKRYAVCCNRLGEQVYSVETSSDTFGGLDIEAMGNILLIRQTTRVLVPGEEGEPERYIDTIKNYIAK